MLDAWSHAVEGPKGAGWLDWSEKNRPSLFGCGNWPGHRKAKEVQRFPSTVWLVVWL
jgi:hypothetical protein